MVEYSLILVLIAIAAIAGLLVLGPALSQGFVKVSGFFGGPASPGV